MIEVNNLTKVFGDKRAVSDISFTVGTGEVLGLLGPNGAGKSTAMNMITGYIPMTSGSVRICGIDITENPIEAKRNIGYLPEQPPVYPEMTVGEYLSFVCELKGVKDIKEETARIAGLSGTDGVIGRRIGNLSKGYRQRTGLAAALAKDPKVLILDEPTVGLDPKQIVQMRKLIRELGKDRSIILSSHILTEIDAVCDRILIIKNGTIAAENPVRSASDIKRIAMRIDGDDKDICTLLDGFEGVTYKILGGGRYELDIENASDEKNREIFFAFANAGIPILEQREEEISLEDIFMGITDDTEGSGQL